MGRTFGSREQPALLREISRGAYRLETFDAADVDEARDVFDRYTDLGVSLADASIVVLSRRHGVNDLLLDERHFRVLRGAGDRRFRLLPADA